MARRVCDVIPGQGPEPDLSSDLPHLHHQARLRWVVTTPCDPAPWTLPEVGGRLLHRPAGSPVSVLEFNFVFLGFVFLVIV